FYIGIDTSKLTVDIAVLQENSIISRAKIKNSEQELSAHFRTLKADHKCNNKNCLICAEDGGLYNTFLCNVCEKRKLNLCIESALRIKKSLGIQRGKNDALDAVRIAGYASRHYTGLRLWHPVRPVLGQLKSLSVIRERIIKARTMLLNSKKDENHFLPKRKSNDLKKYLMNSGDGMKQDIMQVESEMEKIIEGDGRLKRLMDIITTVPCIGKVIATEMIITTSEFDPSWTAKTFSSYCGIAPFEWTSGESVRGKAKVSHYANKNIKRLLHLAALGIVQIRKSCLKNYYERKVAEGKNKMSILNAIRNKLVAQVFACVRNDSFYKEPILKGDIL
ncbi:MAG: IS110 family transposase, partial [Bacteroidota bacterium]